jgi:hypothetical protein
LRPFFPISVATTNRWLSLGTDIFQNWMALMSSLRAALFKTIALIVIVLAILFLMWAVNAIYNFSTFVIHGFQLLKPETYIPILATVFTAMLGVSAALLTQVYNRKRAAEEAHRAKKIEIYIGFLKIMQSVMLSQKPEFSDLEIQSADLTRKLADFRTDITLWASPQVLKALANFNLKSSIDGGRGGMLAVDALYRAMRTDIGLSNAGLKKDHFVKAMLTNPDELDELKKGQQH